MLNTYLFDNHFDLISNPDKLFLNDEYRSALIDINQTCSLDGNSFSIEGNLFYFHKKQYQINEMPDPLRVNKRKNLLLFAQSGRSILEIGVNAGHSALLLLLAYKNIVYTGIDIETNKYTNDAVKHLKSKFHERFNYIKGDSREVLPGLVASNQKFDLFHIDGGHSAITCKTDISNCLKLSRKKSLMLIDDSNVPHIKQSYSYFVSAGHLISENFSGMFDESDQVCAHCCP